MRPHRGLEVALLTKRRPPLQPQQVFGCNKDPTDPWPLQLHMHGPWLPILPVPPGGDAYRSVWQVHNDAVPYQTYPYHSVDDAYPGDQRLLQPRGLGNCQTYSLCGVDFEYTGGRLYFQSRLFASPPGSLGAWDFSWSTTLTALTSTNDNLLFIWSNKGHGCVLRNIGGYLCRLTNFAEGWVQLMPFPAMPPGHVLRLDFQCLVAPSWCKVHLNGQTFTLDYGTPFSAFDLVTVELVNTNGETGGTVGGQSYGRIVQVSDIAIMSAPANKFTTYPFE